MLDDIEPPDWRECNLHALRIMYARLLYDVHQHRRRVTQEMWPRDHADDELWKNLSRNNFDFGGKTDG